MKIYVIYGLNVVYWQQQMLRNPISTSKVSSFNSQEHFFVTLAQIYHVHLLYGVLCKLLKIYYKKTFIEVLIMMY